MKKVLCLILVAFMIVTISLSPAYALNVYGGKERLFEDEFLEHHASMLDKVEPYYAYDELYVHHIDESDPESEVDWVLVSASFVSGHEFRTYGVFEDWVIISSILWTPYQFHYAIYDVKTDVFYPYNLSWKSFDGITEVMDKIPAAYPIGDADLDHTLSIRDATLIQRALAKVSEFKKSDDLSDCMNNVGELSYLSDFNRDGERSILDATAIQMKLAKIEDTATTE